MRLNKYLARAGVTSRRKADDLIEAGRVAVEGATVREMGARVDPNDSVTVDGEPACLAPLRYVLLNKPADAVTTMSDERGRRTVMDLVEGVGDGCEALFPVGRLDRDTTGVLLLTTDGDLAHRLMHPSYEVEKLYLVRLREPIVPAQVEQLRRGVALDDGTAAADDARCLRADRRTELFVTLHEGRNRQVRRMMQAVGHEVAALERTRYASLSAEGLERGAWRLLDEDEVKRLRRSVGLPERKARTHKRNS
jgi:23S rRNA pseudouridine2605 synthase